MKLLIIISTALLLFTQPAEAAKGIIVGKPASGTTTSAGRGLKALIISGSATHRNITKPNIPGPYGMQVNSFTGNLFHQRNDVSIPGRGLPIDLTFSYNSGLTKNDFGFGKGWTANFNMIYQRTPGLVTIRCEDGRKDKFTEGPGGYTPPVGVFADLSEYTPGKFLLRTKYGMQYFFDDSTHKKLTKIQDPNGNTITLSSFVSGQPSYITDANGRSIRLGWSGGHLAYILDSIASPPRTTSYQYDARGNLKRVTYPMGYVYQYRYDARSRLIGFTDELSNTVAIAFNDSGAVTSITTPGSSATPPTTLSIVYNPAAHTTTASELVAGIVQSTTYTFDGSDRLIHIQGSCCGLDVQYQYDSQNNVTRIVNPNGNGTDYTYDSKGNRLTETNALGQTASWSYEPVFNRVTSSTDRRGNTTTFSYDTHGNLLTVSRPLGIADLFTYDAFGNMVSTTDGRGNTTTCSYDANGNLVSVSHPIGSESFTHDNSGNIISSTDADGHTTTYVYDALDRRVSMTNAIGGNRLYVYGGIDNLTQETDENGHSTSYTYDALNRLVAVTRPEGTALFTLDEYGNLQQSVDFRGNMTSYTYDGRNRPTIVTDALGHSRSLTYDNNSNVLTETDFNGNLTTYLYDLLDRATKKTNLYGFDVLLVYDQNGNAVAVTDENGHVITYSYDALDRQVLATYPIGSQSSSYDNNSNLVSNTDPNGHTTVYAYDANNRLTSSLDPLLHTTSVSYAPAGNVVSMTDPNGLTSTYSYDGLHRMVSSANPMSEATTCTYDAVGNRLSCILPHGNTLSYAYDASNRVTSASDALGTVASYTYDANSNLLTEADANSNTTQYVYDPLDRVTSTIAPLGQSTLYAYDNNSNVVSTTDGAGGTTTYTYDGLNRQTSTTFPGGLTTTCSYDAVGNLTSILDGRGNTTGFILDILDRVTQVSYANGSHRQCTYDLAGNVLTLQDQNANTITYAYDAMDRKISRNFPDGTSDVYMYDNAGRMTSANNTPATIGFTYDGADRILSEVLNGKTTSYSYNIVGRTVTTTYPGGRVVTDVMNTRLLTTSQNSGASSVADYSYDAASRMVSQTNANGSSTSYSYNDNDWATGVSHNRGGALMAGFNYTFDNRGFRKSVEKLHRPTNSEQYQYDATTRLTGYREGTLVGGIIPAPLTQTQFTFDAIGNRTNSTKDAVPTTYVANSINAYTSVSGGISLTPTYDGDGNMTSDGARAFTYDYMDRLTGVLDVATNAAYTYDALGRRIMKIVNGVITKYFYDGDEVVEERDGSDVVKTTYTTLAEIVPNETITLLLKLGKSMTRHLGSVTQDYYFHRNSLGSVVAVTDDSDRVAERYEYDSFGNVSIYDSAYVPRATSAIGNVYLFGGMEYDAESGLYYVHARHYSPQVGRFMQQDPTSIMGDEPDLLNGYSYVGNNPTNFNDPSGEMKNGTVKFFNEAKGFGFVATVAIPNYSKFQGKAKQSEAIRNFNPLKGDYLPAHNWKIEIDGVITGGFRDFGDRMKAGLETAGGMLANGASVVGGLVPGGTILSAAVSSVSQLGGGRAHWGVGWYDGLTRFASGPRQTTSQDGSFSHRGWDGTIKGFYGHVNDFNPGDMVHPPVRFWYDRDLSGDGVPDLLARGPRQTTSQDGSFSHRHWRDVKVTASQNSQSLRTILKVTASQNSQSLRTILKVTASQNSQSLRVGFLDVPPGVPWDVPFAYLGQDGKYHLHVTRSNISNN